MNYYNRINMLIDEMVDDVKYIKTTTFLNSLKK